MSRRAAVVGAVLLLALPGCGTSFVDTVAAERSGASAGPTVDAGPTPGAGDGCGARAQPDPDRPGITYDFRLSDDLRTVTGTETVVFAPDVRTGELVFRLVPNAPGTAAAGNRLTVDGVQGDDVTGGRYVAAGAAGPGGLYVVDLEGELVPGQSTEVELDFTLTLGSGGLDRVGSVDGVSWWGSGAPLLAWEPGVGWARDPFVDLIGETASSPAADTRVRVSAPAELTVLMTGEQDEPSAPQGGRRTWTSSEPAARDVAVTAGPLDTATATSRSGVRVTAGVPSGTGDAESLADRAAEAIDVLEARFGPFPYETLAVPLLPIRGGGVEYPSSVLMAGADRGVLVHEVAHMWFYGMVGGSQFRDPWLDESFAGYAETVDAPRPELGGALGVPGDVGSAMDEFPDDRAYVQRVYGKGAAALLAAREAAGPAAFDAALRCYVDAQAWTTATPEDLARALAELPAALDVLVDAGALQPEDLPG